MLLCQVVKLQNEFPNSGIQVVKQWSRRSITEYSLNQTHFNLPLFMITCIYQILYGTTNYPLTEIVFYWEIVLCLFRPELLSLLWEYK